MLRDFFFSEVLVWLPWSFSLVILLLIITKLWLKKYKIYRLWRLENLSFLKLVKLTVGATVLFDLFLTLLQYLTWHNSAFSQFLLPPYQPWSYFIGYSFFNFWLANLLTLVAALLFFLVFKIIKKLKPEAGSGEELNLVLLLSLLLAWPRILIFIPLFLFLSLLYILVNLLVIKQKRSSLSIPLLAAALTVFLFGAYLINVLKMAALML
jgi:hypothetical protein